MTCLRPDPARSTFDLPLETANERIEALHREAVRDHVTEAAPGPVDRVRDGLGRGLIALGAAIRPANRARHGSVVSR